MPTLSNFISLNLLVASIRIVFGVIFLAKQIVAIDAKSLVWAQRRPFGMKNEFFFDVLLWLHVGTTLFFTIGLCTGPAALFQWGLYVLLNRAASLYGLEDVVFQILSFYFIFATAGASLSVDAAFGITAWRGLLPGTLLPELFLSLALALVFLSAGVEKLKSPMWRRGLGAYYFFLIPQFRRVSTAVLTRHRALIYFINYAAMVMQLLCLPFFLINALPLGFVCWSFTLSFAFLLSTVFVLTWIGECLFLGLLIVGWTLVDAGTRGLGLRISQEWHRLETPSTYTLATLIAITLSAALWTVIFPSSPRLARYPRLMAWHKFMRSVARFSWGIAPAKVFTELHIQGPVVYRVFFDFTDTSDAKGQQIEQEVFRIFSPLCGPGSERSFRPAFFEVTSYKIAEACMEFDLHGHIATPERFDFVLKLAQFIAKKVKKKTGMLPTRLLFRIVQIVPPAEFIGASSWYSHEKWIDAFAVTFANHKPVRLEAISRPILKAPTGRDLQRVSFEFNPLSP